MNTKGAEMKSHENWLRSENDVKFEVLYTYQMFTDAMVKIILFTVDELHPNKQSGGA